MCGIAGSFQLDGELASRSVIEKMTNCMSHRGPDADGFHIDGPIALGHRRLSIIDLSEKSNQPIYDATGRYAIIFNGEIYNYTEVKASLPGYPFKTTGDTEVVLAAYIQWGAEALHQLKGFFAFAIWDKSKQELFVARDRLGVKPVYYFKDQRQFIFASEIRSILSTEKVPRKIHRNALTDYLSYQSFQSPQTIVDQIVELPAGYSLIISSSQFLLKSYWQPFDCYGPAEPLDKKAAASRTRELLLQSVQRRMVSDVPVAAFLSGGIDSSVVVGLMAQIADKPETFNIAFQEKDFDESVYAKLIAKKFNTRHHELLIKPEVFLTELPNALNAMDSPSGDGVNTYVISQAIRKAGIKVALSGVGGDELFAGYPIFKAYEKIQRNKWIWSLPAVVRRTSAAILNNNDIKRQRIVQLLGMNNCNIANAYHSLRQVNSDRMISNLLSFPAAETSLMTTLKENENLIGRFPLYSQVSIAEYLGYTRQTLLKDTDQMSMAWSLEVREPFFDHELIEYVLQVPDDFKKGEQPKSLLLEATGDLIPPEIYQRPKKGFTFPWNYWLRNELKSFCQARIEHLAERDFMNAKVVSNYWNNFLSGTNGVGYSNILTLVALENYLEQHQLH